jgi:hypothetical protein
VKKFSRIFSKNQIEKSGLDFDKSMSNNNTFGEATIILIGSNIELNFFNDGQV